MPGAGERARPCSGSWESRGAGGTGGRGDLSKRKVVETVFPSATRSSRVCWHQAPSPAILVLRSRFGAKSALGVGERFARRPGVRASDAFPVSSPWDGLRETQTEGSERHAVRTHSAALEPGARGQPARESLRPLSSGADFGTGLPPRCRGVTEPRKVAAPSSAEGRRAGLPECPVHGPAACWQDHVPGWEEREVLSCCVSEGQGRAGPARWLSFVPRVNRPPSLVP